MWFHQRSGSRGGQAGELPTAAPRVSARPGPEGYGDPGVRGPEWCGVPRNPGTVGEGTWENQEPVQALSRAHSRSRKAEASRAPRVTDRNNAQPPRNALWAPGPGLGARGAREPEVLNRRQLPAAPSDPARCPSTLRAAAPSAPGTRARGSASLRDAPTPAAPTHPRTTSSPYFTGSLSGALGSSWPGENMEPRSAAAAASTAIPAESAPPLHSHPENGVSAPGNGTAANGARGGQSRGCSVVAARVARRLPPRALRGRREPDPARNASGRPEPRGRRSARRRGAERAGQVGRPRRRPASALPRPPPARQPPRPASALCYVNIE